MSGKWTLLPLALLLLPLFPLATLPTYGQEIPWKAVEMKASKLFVTTTSTISVQLLSREEALEELLPHREHPPLPPAGKTVVLAEVENSLLGRDSTTRLWSDPGGRALQRIKVETGKKHRYKAQRFATDGVITTRRYPDEGKEEEDPSTWGKPSEEFTAVPLGKKAVAEPTALLYLLATAPLHRAGDRWETEIFTDDSLHRLEVRVEKVTRIKARYTTERGKKEEAFKGDVEALHLTLRPKREKDSTGGDFEFLGLEGDVDVYLHRNGRFPLEVQGKIPIAGKVRIVLEKVKF